MQKSKIKSSIQISQRSIFEPEILGNHNINSGTALLLKTTVN